MGRAALWTVAGAALLAAVSAAAAWLPAYRATRISAAVALRDVT